MPQILTEDQLIRGCRRGERTAQFSLYQQHKIYMFGICQRYGKTRQEAEDILQEGFYHIFKDIKQYKSTGPFRAWMRKVMVNTALMYIRKNHKLEYLSLDGELSDHHIGSDTSLLNSDRSKAIIKLIQELPLSQQMVFNLKAIDGFSFKEIAVKMETKEATLRSHYLRARTRLQSLLRKELEKNG